MKKHFLAYIGAGLGLGFLWFFFIFGPNRLERENQKALINEALSQLADFDRIMSTLPTSLTASENLEAARVDLMSHLYAKTDILQLFDQLEATAEGTNLRPIEIRPSIRELLQLNSLVPTSDQPLFVNIEMRLRGGYLDCGRFIQALEHQPYFRGVSYCRLSAERKTSEQLLSLEIGFKAMLGLLEDRS